MISYMKQNKKQKQGLESAQYGLEISFKNDIYCSWFMVLLNHFCVICIGHGIKLHVINYILTTRNVELCCKQSYRITFFCRKTRLRNL